MVMQLTVPCAHLIDDGVTAKDLGVPPVVTRCMMPPSTSVTTRLVSLLCPLQQGDARCRATISFTWRRQCVPLMVVPFTVMVYTSWMWQWNYIKPKLPCTMTSGWPTLDESRRWTTIGHSQAPEDRGWYCVSQKEEIAANTIKHILLCLAPPPPKSTSKFEQEG